MKVEMWVEVLHMTILNEGDCDTWFIPEQQWLGKLTTILYSSIVGNNVVLLFHPGGGRWVGHEKQE